MELFSIKNIILWFIGMLHGSKLQASSEGFVQISWDGKLN